MLATPVFYGLDDDGCMKTVLRDTAMIFNL